MTPETVALVDYAFKAVVVVAIVVGYVKKGNRLEIAEMAAVVKSVETVAGSVNALSKQVMDAVKEVMDKIERAEGKIQIVEKDIVRIDACRNQPIHLPPGHEFKLSVIPAAKAGEMG